MLTLLLTYSNQLDFGEIDLSKYKPHIRDLAGGETYSRDDVRSMRKQATSLAIRLKRYGVKGEKYGAQKIQGVIKEKFPSDNKPWFIPSRSAIDNWIKLITFAKDEPAYSTEAVPKQWRSYVARLSLISQFWHERPLTGHEAEVAQYVGNEFQNPYGEQVDLIPQLAIVREIASLEAMKKNSWLEAFETYFTFAPWKIGTDLYIRNMPLSDWRVENGFPFPILTDFLLLASESENYKLVSPVFEEALVQLGLSYRYLYFDLDLDAPQVSDKAFYGDSAKGRCNWKSILETRDNAYDKELQSLEQQLKQSAEQATHIVDGGVAGKEFLQYRVANKKDEWKQVERVPFTEDIND